jgi:hypothetical protein
MDLGGRHRGRAGSTAKACRCVVFDNDRGLPVQGIPSVRRRRLPVAGCPAHSEMLPFAGL